MQKKKWIGIFDMKNKIYLVPGFEQKENVWMYCNYARMNPYEERCLNCQNDCQHKGKHTILERKR